MKNIPGPPDTFKLLYIKLLNRGKIQTQKILVFVFSVFDMGHIQNRHCFLYKIYLKIHFFCAIQLYNV